MHGVMKVKRINANETKFGTILVEINPEAQTKREDIANRLLNSQC